jgi:tetratricopeptide (TPR) repeat protein
MSPEDWDRCKQIFCDALELIPEERILLLERECGGNSELRAQVLKMLGAAADNDSLLEVGAAEQLVESLQRGEPLMAGDLVGRYRVLRRIGQGGTSLVYLAEHADLHSPRRFAIKAIASAFIAGQHEKFERECEILAAFEHPNIARIIDKGVTETGWPYLVMDYIDGTPIHKYCINHKLAPPEIVRLMLDCCQAVKYIHGNLVVHCDLKPTNILADASGSPRILDFGIARLIEPGRKTRTGQTTRGVRPLTPNYASPEQLAGAPLTTSTDIYSLGVVLYECLTGTLPFDHSDYPWPQINKSVAEQDPAPPSRARLNIGSTREDTLFAQQLRGDLDSIVLKTLAHDPEQRYQSVVELGNDLDRYLVGDVVRARRSTWFGRTRKRLKRQRRVIFEFLLVCLSIILAAGFASWNASRQRRNREMRYLDELRAIVKQVIVPLPENLRVGARAALAEQASKTIDSVLPTISQYPELVPDLGDALLTTADALGNPYGFSVGRVDEARAHYRRALDLMHGRIDLRAIDIRARAYLGLGDTYSHPAVNRDLAEAADWYQRALREVSSPNTELNNTTALAHNRMGILCELLGDTEDARTHYREALRLFSPGTETKRPLDSAFNLIWRAGMKPPDTRAATYLEGLKSLDGLPGTNTPGSPAWHGAIEAYLALGLAELQPGQLPEAEKHFVTAAGLAQQGLDQDSEDVQARGELAVALRRHALVQVIEGKLAVSDALRDRATEVLTSAMSLPEPGSPDPQANSPCPESTERLIEGSPPAALRPGDLLIANRKASGLPGTILAFSPASLEMSVLAIGGYLSDIVDVVSASRTEIYALDRSFSHVVRLRYQAGRWLQKPVACGGLLRRPAALAYSDGNLILADADSDAVRLIGIDPATGQQTLLSRTNGFTQPGKIVHAAAGDYYLSLFWPGEGGPAEILRFNAKTRKFASAARYGLLDEPAAIALTPRGDLIAGDREWAGNSGYGDLLRIDRNGVQKILCRKPELSRVTAVAVASEREAWYTTASVPYSSSPTARPKLFKLDLVTGNTTEVTISEKYLSAPSALVRVQ